MENLDTDDMNGPNHDHNHVLIMIMMIKNLKSAS